MSNGIYKALSASRAQLRHLDVLANNMANVSTPGFKADTVRFEEVLHTRMAGGRSEFVQVVESDVRLTQGTLRATGNPLDVAISGDGFFVVETPDGQRLTRAGHFSIGRDGILRTDSGHAVLGESGTILVPPGLPNQRAPLQIDGEGRIRQGNLEIGKLRRVTVKASQLTKQGNNLFRSSVEPGRLEEATGGEFVQGHVELSNVNPVQAMIRLVQVQRMFDSLLQAIKAYREVDSQSIRRMR